MVLIEMINDERPRGRDALTEGDLLTSLICGAGPKWPASQGQRIGRRLKTGGLEAKGGL